MTPDDPASIVRLFTDRINAGDAAGLVALMTEDHRFVDATGAVHAGRDEMGRGWREYLACFPDYRIDVDELLALGDVVALFGHAMGAFRGDAAKRWRIPAAWRARVREGRVEEWRVYCDVEPMLRSMGIDRFAGGRGP